eukprot:COSAG02_NODE_1743_length_11100_cov_17.677575_12_plen_127_part_00
MVGPSVKQVSQSGHCPRSFIKHTLINTNPTTTPRHDRRWAAVLSREAGIVALPRTFGRVTLDSRSMSPSGAPPRRETCSLPTCTRTSDERGTYVPRLKGINLRSCKSYYYTALLRYFHFLVLYQIF